MPTKSLVGYSVDLCPEATERVLAVLREQTGVGETLTGCDLIVTDLPGGRRLQGYVYREATIYSAAESDAAFAAAQAERELARV